MAIMMGDGVNCDWGEGDSAAVVGQGGLTRGRCLSWVLSDGGATGAHPLIAAPEPGSKGAAGHGALHGHQGASGTAD